MIKSCFQGGLENGFFHVKCEINRCQLLIGVQDEDSCGKSELGETPQERMRRGGSPTARGKRSLARKSKAVINVFYEV
jgi:hypothetical protein